MDLEGARHIEEEKKNIQKPASEPVWWSPVRKQGSSTNQGKQTGEVINDYAGFESAASDFLSKRKSDTDNLTPIYELRRKIGDRVTRKEFNNHLLDLQANDKVQLAGSSNTGVKSSEIEDSFAIPGAGSRFFIKDLT